MIFFLLIFHLLVTLVMIGVVLLQKGEDAGAGVAANSTGMFSARGAKNILTRATAILATLFFTNCLLLAVLVKKNSRLDNASTVQHNEPAGNKLPSEKKEWPVKTQTPSSGPVKSQPLPVKPSKSISAPPSSSRDKVPPRP